ncbi:thioredoxin [Cupriavidus sp. USMAA2-4]|uniref:thioredoxin n=1 Tax=unclassified Cupriavidus TaxID=2640874 RepID=UPI0008A678DD|nr:MULTISPECIES: thioredoxin [unclassified Cupriavidus]AOY93208.1 thioredoxin [Cupriavidus sp. USMAA2-4]AOZ00501.1 thioredoxin [Cupriavidus sp. USMAHM13]
MSDTTLQTFEADVIEMSRQVPVLVDFWAPWCGPCRTLGPMLEKLEHEAAGKWKLVKINVDEHQPLAAHFGVRSIPHVIAFVDGKPVDQFVGVLPESGLREFLARVTPAPSALALRQARELAADGQREAALAAFQAALALDPGADAARIEYAGFLLDGNAITEAEAEFGMLSARAPQQDGYDALRTRLQTVREASALPDASVLSARVAADPGDLAARLDLARQHIAHHDYEAALEQLLAIVRADRAYEDGVARKTMLAVFDLMADRPDAVSRWRRQLSTALN